MIFQKGLEQDHFDLNHSPYLIPMKQKFIVDAS